MHLYGIKNDDKDRHSKYMTKAVDYYRQLLSQMAIKEKEIELDEEVFKILDRKKGQQFIYDDKYVE